ncbi:dynein regulatory complex subunit 2 [Cardiocondyla obscurior]|uniref:dynein regulatory complex subunit 2 n=1 Tax=Cardiocondyla obscurior TaxID=286306 RepID=UPI003965769A
MDELAESEEQYQMNTKSHIEIIDRLLKTYKERMERDEKNYRNALNEAVIETNTEITKINYQQNKNETLLQSVIHGVKQQLEELLDNAKSMTLSKIDAFVEDNEDKRKLFITQCENQVQGYCENLQRVLSDYEEKTKNCRKYYEVLKEKDEKDQQMIAQQLLRTTSLFEEIRRLQGKITVYDATAKKEISKILTEHDFFQGINWTIKNNFFSEQMKDKNQLKILSIEYNKTIKHLEYLADKGRQLFTLLQICQKYETENEKIVTFMVCEVPESSQSISSHQILALSDYDVSLQNKELQKLINFWRRFGLVQITIMQLLSEKNKLKAELNYLRKCINSYMTQKR